MMRTALSFVVLSVAFGLSGQAKAGALSDLIGKFPMPTFSLNCLEPADKDTSNANGAPVQRDRRESAARARARRARRRATAERRPRDGRQPGRRRRRQEHARTFDEVKAFLPGALK
jgi:hypothetical protein